MMVALKVVVPSVSSTRCVEEDQPSFKGLWFYATLWVKNHYKGSAARERLSDAANCGGHTHSSIFSCR